MIRQRSSHFIVIVRTFTCNERNKLAHAFLHAFFCFFGNFGVLGQRSLHDSSDWSKVAYVSIRDEAMLP